jgi:hypothetical protein
MNLNIENFKEVLKKATLNFLIESIQLKITKDTIISKMISQSNDGIAILNIKNEIITDMKKTDEFTFNFLEPNQTLIPYLNLADEQTTIKVQDEKIVLTTGRQKSNVFFCAPQVVRVFTSDSLRDDIQYFKDIEIDDGFIQTFNKIKKIAPKFGKIYFNVYDKMLSIETTDKTNNFSNGVLFDIDDAEYDNLSMLFDYKSIAGVMNIVGEGFTARFAYVPEQEMGMIYFSKEDGTEKYYLMSKQDS